MKKFSITTISITILSATLGTNAFAEQSIAINGVYLGAGATAVSGIMDNQVHMDPGATIALGYRINNNFALETSYTRFFDAFASGQIVDLTVKALKLITPNFSLYGKLGTAMFHARADIDFLWVSEHHSETRFAPEAGAGLSYNFTPNFAIELDVSVIPVSGLTLVPVKLGLRYTFG